MLRKIENINIKFIPHIFTKGHVQLVVGRNIYEYKKLRVDKNEYQDILTGCYTQPFKFTAGDKVYWLFEEAFFKDNDGLGPDDVKALILSRQRMQQQRIKRAKTITAAPELKEKLRRGVIPDDTKLLIWQRDSGKCVKCGLQSELQFDHIIPISVGGASTPENLQILCGRCNRIKSASIV